MSDAKQVAVVTGNNMLTDSGRFEHTWRVAKVFAGSQLIPAHLRGKVEDVMIALHVAERLREDPLTVMQSIYIVSGRAGWSASYMVARINQSGLVKGRIRWTEEGSGENLVVTARAVLADTGEEVSAPVSMRMAIAEGWIRNAKYQSMPNHMLRWRAAAMLQRLYFPEVMLGMPTAEELEDTAPAVKDISPPTAEGRPTAALALEQFAKSDTVETVAVADEKSAALSADGAPAATATTEVAYGGPAGGSMEAASPKRERKPRAPKSDAPPPPVVEATELPVTEQMAHGVAPDQDVPEFDPSAYFDQISGQLPTVESIEELDAAHDVVKVALAKFPSWLGRWNSLRIARMGELRLK